MRVIPVLDVRDGRAVHAAGGARARYGPLRTRLVDGSDPAAVAVAFRTVLGLGECYLADLDAIEGGAPDTKLVRAIADAGLEPWVDAGISDPARARDLLAAGARRIVIGLETLGDTGDLARIAAEAAAPTDRLAFSLDLDGARPLTAIPELMGSTPLEVMDLAVRAGYGTIIVLDLARVGGRAGPPERLLRTLGARFPGVELIVGGGVRDIADLRRAAAAGCSAALVGTALHQGRITREDIEALGSAQSNDSR